jgi:protein SCO1/2
MMWLPLALLLAKSLLIEGLVLEVNSKDGVLVVSHKEIPGTMPAMSMPVRVRNTRQLDGVRPGMRVQFELDISGSASSARNLRILRAENTIEEDGRKVALPVPKEAIAPGDEMPDFLLRDQHGEAFRFHSSRGNVVAIQFLYTRCPMPEVCPRLAATFARLQQRFKGQPVTLLSVTLDPIYDTPEVLSRYATFYRADASSWKFLSGTEEQIRRVAASFGIVYWPEDGAITHTSNIGIVGRSGRLEAVVEGLSFTAQQLGDMIAHQLKREAR